MVKKKKNIQTTVILPLLQFPFQIVTIIKVYFRFIKGKLNQKMVVIKNNTWSQELNITIFCDGKCVFIF